MSAILKLIGTLEKAGQLHLVEPLISDGPRERFVFVSPTINRKLEGPWKSRNDEEQWLTAHAQIDDFSQGNRMHVGAHPDGKHLKLLSPPQDGVFSLRATHAHPGKRLLGFFAAKDILVLLVWSDRNRFTPQVSASLMASCKNPLAEAVPPI